MSVPSYGAARSGRVSLRAALLLTLADRKGATPAKDVIADALGRVEPPLAGKTPQATAHAQIVKLVADGLAERPKKGHVRATRAGRAQARTLSEDEPVLAEAA